jgi:tRNA (guanine-N7-)-methyltransferase
MKEYERKDIRSYVLRTSRLSNLQKKAIEIFSDKYCIPFSKNFLNFKQVFNNSNPVVLEIGFGMGHATLEIAETNINKNYIGIEVHTPGVGKVLNQIDINNLSNLKVIRNDAVEVIRSMIAPGSLEGVHIFFPDPWPKKKHHKRRLINEGFIKELSFLIKKGGYIYITTDWEDYAEKIMLVLQNIPDLYNPYKLYAEKIDWRPETSFERKGIAKDHRIREIWFELK